MIEVVSEEHSWLYTPEYQILDRTIITDAADPKKTFDVSTLRQQLEELQEKAAETPSDRLVEQARVALERQVQMRDALIRVQVTDDAVPQLPQQVRNLVDAALEESSGKTVNLVNPKGRKGAKA